MFEGLLPKHQIKLEVPKVNLFPEDPFYDTIIGKALKWAVSVGRHIVIFTEIVVIGSFFTRFTLDRQLTDLNTSILQKQSIAESYGDLDANLRDLQKRTKDVADILSQQGRYQILQTLSTITPPDIVYEQVSLNADHLTLQGRALSNNGLATLLDGLRHRPEFENISLGSIKNDQSNQVPGTSFSISLTYTKGLVIETVVKTAAAGPSPSPTTGKAGL